MIDDGWAQQRAAVTRLILCSGKVYVDLVSNEGRLEAERVAIARVEQLYPFPDAALRGVIERYSNLREVIWLPMLSLVSARRVVRHAAP